MRVRLKTSPLFDSQLRLGAKMTPVRGWNLPLHYTDGAAAEHRHTRRQASVFDRHGGVALRLSDDGAAALLAAVPHLEPAAPFSLGECRRVRLRDAAGNVADELRICAMAPDDFFCFSAAGAAAAAETLRAAAREPVTVEELTPFLGVLALRGPEAPRVLGALEVPAAELPAPDHCVTRSISGVTCIVCRTDEGGEIGFELFCDAERVEEL